MVAFVIVALVFVIIIALVLWNNPKKLAKSIIIKQPETSNLPGKNIRISVKDAEKYYLKGISDPAMSTDLDMAIINGGKYIYISQERLDLLEARLKQRNGFDNDLAKLTQLKYNAHTFEKDKMLNEAFEAYKVLITFAHNSPYLQINSYSHDMNRFRIVSNKLKKKEEYEKFMSTIKFDH
ncbi:hypothetical protein FEM33_01695 [Dyadobacter flavalbus]|uniref:Uncharacterized protein n=1 Tax=Dyadobacter flavalbus TaxID=2579942 RepID=A0A5M8R3A3_9BACT|nr:hypothetical protein [Dyadobacter flavalbus]KAA6441474.1 hypothetical protein FEM33_01695 [Dyadobacter flavalbus]